MNNETSNRILDGLATYYKTHITCADGSQQNDDYVQRTRMLAERVVRGSLEAINDYLTRK